MVGHRSNKVWSYPYILFGISGLIILIIIIYLISQFGIKVKKENSLNEQLLDKRVAEMSYIMEETKGLVNRIKISDTIKYNNILMNPHKRIKIIDELENLANTSDSIEEVVVHLERDPYMYTSTTTCSFDNFWDLVYKSPEYSKEEFGKILTTNHKLKTLKLKKDTISGDIDKIGFIYPLTKDGVTNYGSVILIIDNNRLFQKLGVKELDYLHISGEEQQVSIEYGGKGLMEEVGPLDGYRYGLPYSGYVQKDPTFGFSYVMVKSNKDINNRLHKVKMKFIFLGIVVICLFGISMYYLILGVNEEVKKNRTPKEIMEMFIVHRLLLSEPLEATDLEDIRLIGEHFIVAILTMKQLSSHKHQVLDVLHKQLVSHNQLNYCLYRERNQVIILCALAKSSLSLLKSSLQEAQEQIHFTTAQDTIIGVGSLCNG